MSKINVVQKNVTHEGALASNITAELQLSRLVMSSFLWEKQFYVNGEDISHSILEFAKRVSPDFLSRTAVYARSKANLRHVPLYLTAILASHHRTYPHIADTIEHVIQRADEIGEFLALYAQVNGVHPSQLKPVLSAQVKKGIAKAFHKFDAYRLAKYNRKGAVTLKDALCLTHPKPVADNQSAIWKQLLEDALPSPDTWEVALSSGADKQATFERLLREGSLGYLALLRNLRNMEQAGVSPELIREAILARKGANRVLPFRFIAAARHAPRYEPELDKALLASLAEMSRFEGTTAVLVDVSGSMFDSLSRKSDLKRVDAAAALGAMLVSLGEVRLFSFSDRLVEVPPRAGMAGVEAIINSQSNSSTRLAEAVTDVNKTVKHDRIIVITDEQATGTIWRPGAPDPVAEKAYMINVASYQNGVGYKRWVHIDGFSENVLRFIHEFER